MSRATPSDPSRHRKAKEFQPWSAFTATPAPVRPANWPVADRSYTLETHALTEAAAGRLRPAVQRYPLADAAAAHRALETRGTIGKVVLEP
ncbi:zinc-binding dehydrogenase [Streptomyces sp. NPDC006261]|uniref:zinc-binding dehydrogenase n=1 Tax=Streptomyces sp. NPDC006261 TaxID=3156739 RepID=UPI0033A273CA